VRLCSAGSEFAGRSAPAHGRVLRCGLVEVKDQHVGFLKKGRPPGAADGPRSINNLGLCLQIADDGPPSGHVELAECLEQIMIGA
jgi:hypothetical protein